jgi:peptidyl-prolyl cis-trans isomerase D
MGLQWQLRPGVELMLQQTRDRLKGWVAVLIFAPLTLAFALWGIENYQVGGGTYAAKVNGEEISLDEVQGAVRDRIAMFQRMAPDGLTPAQEAQIRADVVNSFVQREVVAQRARKLGYRASDAEVIKAIQQIPQFQVDGKFDRGAYERMLALQGYSPSMFEASMRQDLSLQQLSNGLLRSAFATPDELRRRIELEDEQREVTYAVFPAAAHADEVTVADADVQARYEADKARYVTPETLSIEYLELRADQLASEAEVSETEIRDQYEAEVASGRFQKPEERQARHILLKLEGQDEAAVRAKAEALLARARAGEDFATLARENSEDTSTATDGGELGWVTRDMMVEPFSEALFALTEPKTFSEPVESEFGLHIIELEGIRGGETQPYEEVRDELAQEVKQRRADSLFYDRAERLGQLAFESRDSLQPVAQEMGLTVQRVDGVTRQRGEGLAADEKVRTAVFGEDVLESGQNSDVIELGEGRAVVLRVADRKPEAQRPLEEVRPEIEAQLRAEAATARTEAIAADVLTKLRQGATLEQLAAENRGEYHATGFVGRQAGPAELVKAVFAAPKPDGTPYQGQVALANGDRAVFVLTDVKSGTSPTATVEQRQARRNDLARQRGSADLAAYVAELQAQASVVTSQEQLSTIEE